MWNSLYLSVCKVQSVTQFLGEFEVKLDAKARLVMPAGLLRQLPAAAAGKLVLNRGFEKNLVLYPANEWQVIVEGLNQLNPYVKENREFVRYFLRGATPLELDSANRMLLPKSLQEYAGIEKEVVLSGNLNNIEIWSKQLHAAVMDQEPADFSDLAEKVMGGLR